MPPRRSAPSSGISHSINCGHSTRLCVSVRRRNPLRPMPSGRRPSRRRSRSALTWAKCFRSSRCPWRNPNCRRSPDPGRNPNPGSLRPRPVCPWRSPGQLSPIAIPRRRKRWPNLCRIPCRRTDKSRPGVLRNLPKFRRNRLRGKLRRLNSRLPGWFPILKPRLRKKSLRPNRLEIAPARKCRLKILRRHPNRMGIPARRSLPVCRGHPGRKSQPIPGTSPHTGKHPRGCPNRKQLPEHGRKRALPTRLPERGRILRQRRSRSRRPCSASKRRPSATAINSG